MPARIYLCGPMTGLTVRGASAWREEVRRLLPPPDFSLVSPLRGKKAEMYDRGIIPCADHDLQNVPAISQPSGIYARDRFDVLRADALLVNFLGASAVSIGSCFELAWASLHNKPIVLVMEPRGNPHDHIFVTQAATYHVSTLKEAAQCLKIMFA